MSAPQAKKMVFWGSKGQSSYQNFPVSNPPWGGGWGPDLKGISIITQNLMGISPMARHTSVSNDGTARELEPTMMRKGKLVVKVSWRGDLCFALIRVRCMVTIFSNTVLWFVATSNFATNQSTLAVPTLAVMVSPNQWEDGVHWFDEIPKWIGTLLHVVSDVILLFQCKLFEVWCSDRNYNQKMLVHTCFYKIQCLKVVQQDIVATQCHGLRKLLEAFVLTLFLRDLWRPSILSIIKIVCRPAARRWTKVTDLNSRTNQIPTRKSPTRDKWVEVVPLAFLDFNSVDLGDSGMYRELGAVLYYWQHSQTQWTVFPRVEDNKLIRNLIWGHFQRRNG